MPDFIVVGAGVIGVTTALYLAREGLSVEVVEAREDVGLETSFANGGLLTPSTATPWSSPDVPAMVLRSFGREDAPFLLRARALLRMGLWGPTFLANCRPSKHRASAMRLMKFAGDSLQETRDLVAQGLLGYEINNGGLLLLFRNQAGVSNRNASADYLEGFNVATRRLDSAECLALEPSLEPISNSIRAGLQLPEDAWGDARAFTVAVRNASASLGVSYRFGTAATGIVRKRGGVAGITTDSGLMAADRVIVCAGAFAPKLMKTAGIRVPIEPVKGYSISLDVADLGPVPNRPILDNDAHLAVTPMGRTLRVAGTVEFDGFNPAIKQSRIQNLLKALKDLYPAMSVSSDPVCWSGFRPMTSDGMPLIGETKVPGLFINGGHGALGWTLACGSARLLADAVCGRPCNDGEDDAFSVSRRYL